MLADIEGHLREIAKLRRAVADLKRMQRNAGSAQQGDVSPTLARLEASLAEGEAELTGIWPCGL